MDSYIIIILGIILFILILLNHISLQTVNVQAKAEDGNCSQTVYGCCPDGVNSKIDFYGTNCPSYKPPPGYPNVPPPPPPPGPNPYVPKPIGGCAGTKYGCCPNNYTPKINEQGSNCIITS